MISNLNSLLVHQIRRATKKGDGCAAINKLQRFLELEREAKQSGIHRLSLSNVRILPTQTVLRTIS
jgi:hypothetical protein